MSICIKFRNIVLHYRTGCRGAYEFPVTCEKELFLLSFFQWIVRDGMYVISIKGIGFLDDCGRMMERCKFYFLPLLIRL